MHSGDTARLGRRGRHLVADAQAVVHAGGAKRRGQDVRPPTVQCAAHYAAQPDMAVVYLDRNSDPALARTRPERRILVETLENQLLQVVVIQHPGLGASDCLCSHVPPRACRPGCVTRARTMIRTQTAYRIWTPELSPRSHRHAWLS